MGPGPGCLCQAAGRAGAVGGPRCLPDEGVVWSLSVEPTRSLPLCCAWLDHCELSAQYLLSLMNGTFPDLSQSSRSLVPKVKAVVDKTRALLYGHEPQQPAVKWC
uniref:Uncharacterized protein n=1 Tax=Knipowitschia caucasica TaxID=637954 RepID=A0AAV2J2B8_KNICA